MKIVQKIREINFHKTKNLWILFLKSKYFNGGEG